MSVWYPATENKAVATRCWDCQASRAPMLNITLQCAVNTCHSAWHDERYIQINKCEELESSSAPGMLRHLVSSPTCIGQSHCQQDPLQVSAGWPHQRTAVQTVRSKPNAHMQVWVLSMKDPFPQMRRRPKVPCCVTGKYECCFWTSVLQCSFSNYIRLNCSYNNSLLTNWQKHIHS